MRPVFMRFVCAMGDICGCGLGIQMARVQVQYVRENGVFGVFVSKTRVY